MGLLHPRNLAAYVAAATCVPGAMSEPADIRNRLLSRGVMLGLGLLACTGLFDPTEVNGGFIVTNTPIVNGLATNNPHTVLSGTLVTKGIQSTRIDFVGKHGTSINWAPFPFPVSSTMPQPRRGRSTFRRRG